MNFTQFGNLLPPANEGSYLNSEWVDYDEKTEKQNYLASENPNIYKKLPCFEDISRRGC